MANQGDPELGELQVVGLVIGRYMERKKEFTLGFRLKALFALIDQKKEELSKGTINYAIMYCSIYGYSLIYVLNVFL